MNTPDDDLTDDHMHPLAWLDAHLTGSLAAAAQALGLALSDPDHSHARSGRSLLHGPFAARRWLGQGRTSGAWHRGVFSSSPAWVNRPLARGITRSSEPDGSCSQYGQAFLAVLGEEEGRLKADPELIPAIKAELKDR